MQNNTPMVSVIIPCYNAEKHIRDTLKSAIAQTYSNIEIICVEDGSTDNTLAILSSYHPHIRLLGHPESANKGQWASVNLAIKLSRGKYIAFLDSDDLWTPDKIQKQVDLMEKMEDVGLVYTDAVCVTDNHWYGRRLTEKHVEQNDPDKLLLDCYIVHSSVMVRKCISEDFDTTMQSSDHDMWLRLIEKYKFVYIPEPLTGYHSRNDQISLNRKQWEDGFKILSKVMKRRKLDKTFYKKRKAVLHYRLGMHDFQKKQWISAIYNLIMAFLFDPQRAIKHWLSTPP